MSMDLKTLQTYYNACNPEEALDPEDPRNVDIDAAGSEDGRVRGDNWVRRLAREIELSGDNPVCKYFTGLPGSGKSTELRRLAARLRSKEANRANLLPVIVDAEDVLDLTAEIDIPDIMTALVYGTEREVLKAEGKDPKAALTEGYGQRLWHWLSRTDIRVTSAELGLKGEDVVEGKLVAEMKTRPSLRKRLRETIAAHLTSFLREIRDEFVLLNERARKAGYSGLVVIFDSLEKLQGTSSTWAGVLNSAERVFASDAPYLQLPVHVLYTIPAALTRKLNVDVHFLPMIKLHNRDGQIFEPGFEAARAIVRKRLPDEVLAELLGEAFELRITALLEWSGGYPREIVRLLQKILEIEDGNVTEAELKRILSRAGNAYRMLVLGGGGVDLLARVAVNQSPILETEAEREAFDRMVSNNVVLHYMNDEDWFDLHPAVHEIREVKEAIDRLRAERQTVGI
jgi:hypothetical protein